MQADGIVLSSVAAHQWCLKRKQFFEVHESITRTTAAEASVVVTSLRAIQLLLPRLFIFLDNLATSCKDGTLRSSAETNCIARSSFATASRATYYSTQTDSLHSQLATQRSRSTHFSKDGRP
jgi:hypothetical protein